MRAPPDRGANALRHGAPTATHTTVSQVYRGLDIGSNKPSDEERRRVPHHLIDLCEPAEEYTAGDFYRDSLRTIQEARAVEPNAPRPIACRFASVVRSGGSHPWVASVGRIRGWQWWIASVDRIRGSQWWIASSDQIR